ncbi:hypothetical protein [Agrococcus sp. SGAir0287]|uniref:hypothetical protein n=1 Tax=Agrococcus sp. SGAir0287 TaxID=2070347 RepID=UPI0010CCE494|nr:hypothetical protein [Agrococcus sp. SGAir0287]QCR19160.1 hypothetical protein C1N71_06670 [Agrococcus sp. SGAir0287]
MPELRVHASEWIVVVHRITYAVIRRVTIGGDDDFWRVVTGEDDRSRRRLVGYWGTFEEASHNALAFVEQQLPGAWMATGTSTSHERRAMTPQKPLPARDVDRAPWTGWRTIPRGVDTVWETPHRRRRDG